MICQHRVYLVLTLGVLVIGRSFARTKDADYYADLHKSFAHIAASWINLDCNGSIPDLWLGAVLCRVFAFVDKFLFAFTHTILQYRKYISKYNRESYEHSQNYIN